MKRPVLKLALLVCLLFLFACNTDKKERTVDTSANDTVHADSVAVDSVKMDAMVDSNLKICTPKSTEKLSMPYAYFMQPLGESQKGGIIRNKIWSFRQDAPKILKIYFMDGESAVQERVKKIAKEWEEVSQFKFDFIDSFSGADIRISFKKVGSWSYIGTDSRRYAPSMNLGWLKPGLKEIEYRRVVLHEFGHALGFGHEHQSPANNPIKWNRPKVFYYFVNLQGWNTQMVEDDIFNTFSTDLWIGTEYDPQSIMIYGIDKTLTKNNFEIKWNNKISGKDKETVRKAYGSFSF